MNAAIYIRWSTEDQGTGTTLEVQRDSCLKCAADKGWSVAPEHNRLARSPYLAHKLVEKDWHKQASLVSISEAHIDTTTTTGQLGFGIAAIFAAHERNTICRPSAGRRQPPTAAGRVGTPLTFCRAGSTAASAGAR